MWIASDPGLTMRISLFLASVFFSWALGDDEIWEKDMSKDVYIEGSTQVNKKYTLQFMPYQQDILSIYLFVLGYGVSTQMSDIICFQPTLSFFDLLTLSPTKQYQEALILKSRNRGVEKYSLSHFLV